MLVNIGIMKGGLVKVMGRNQRRTTRLRLVNLDSRRFSGLFLLKRGFLVSVRFT